MSSDEPGPARNGWGPSVLPSSETRSVAAETATALLTFRGVRAARALILPQPVDADKTAFAPRLIP